MKHNSEFLIAASRRHTHSELRIPNYEFLIVLSRALRRLRAARLQKVGRHFLSLPALHLGVNLGARNLRRLAGGPAPVSSVASSNSANANSPTDFASFRVSCPRPVKRWSLNSSLFPAPRATITSPPSAPPITHSEFLIPNCNEKGFSTPS